MKVMGMVLVRRGPGGGGGSVPLEATLVTIEV